MGGGHGKTCADIWKAPAEGRHLLEFWKCMNATLRSQAKYRGVAVKFLLEVGRLRLAAITSAPSCAAPYRAARETGGCSRVESCVSAASQECLHHHWSPATAPSSRTSRAAAGLLSRWSWQRQRLCS